MMDGHLAPEAWVPLRVFLTRSPKPRHVVNSGTALSDVRQGTACCMLFAARKALNAAVITVEISIMSKKLGRLLGKHSVMNMSNGKYSILDLHLAPRAASRSRGSRYDA